MNSDSLPVIAADKVILFLTDGEPTSSLGSNAAIMQTIRDKNQVLGFKVVILTYGMGGEILNEIYQ